MTPSEYVLDLYNMDADEFSAKYKGQYPYPSIVYIHPTTFSARAAFYFLKSIVVAAYPELTDRANEMCYVDLGSTTQFGAMIRIYGDADLLTFMRLRYDL